MTSPTDAAANVAALATHRGELRRLNGLRWLATLAALGWIGIAVAGVWEIVGGAWPYLLFSITLMLAAALSVAAPWCGTRQADRATLRRRGLGIGVLAAASTVVAGASPVWMTLLAIPSPCGPSPHLTQCGRDSQRWRPHSSWAWAR